MTIPKLLSPRPPESISSSGFAGLDPAAAAALAEESAGWGSVLTDYGGDAVLAASAVRAGYLTARALLGTAGETLAWSDRDRAAASARFEDSLAGLHRLDELQDYLYDHVDGVMATLSCEAVEAFVPPDQLETARGQMGMGGEAACSAVSEAGVEGEPVGTEDGEQGAAERAKLMRCWMATFSAAERPDGHGDAVQCSEAPDVR